eukprot:5013715-Prymnesium_polylepis.2
MLIGTDGRREDFLSIGGFEEISSRLLRRRSFCGAEPPNMLRTDIWRWAGRRSWARLEALTRRGRCTPQKP